MARHPRARPSQEHPTAKTSIDGEPLTALKVNTHLNHELSTWTAYTPTWTAFTTNPTLGDGTIEGRYVQIGKTVHFTIALTFGSTTTQGAGAWSFTLPVTAANGTQHPLGSARLRDNSAPAYNMRTAYKTNSTALGLANEAGVNVGSGTPWAWAVNDFVIISGTYEAA